MEKKDENKKPFLSRFSDRTKIAFLRFWFVGLIYYLVGWGTDLGLNEDPVDFIFVLALISSAAIIIIFNPICHYMFDIERNGIIMNKEIQNRKIYQGVLFNLFEFVRCLLVTVLIYLTYELINMAFIHLTNADYLILQGEPILYGVFFTLYYEIFTSIRNKILFLFQSKVKQKKEKK